MGCVPPLPGYFPAIASVVRKHGALLIIDEIMSGMGRCASLPNPTLHYWQSEGIEPSLVTVGKGLSSGYAPISAVLVHPTVSSVFKRGSGAFVHGHTYQAHPLSCTAATTVQEVLHENDKALVKNVATVGAYLGNKLTDVLGKHPNVGNVRGKGLFWGIEFVEDQATKKPFPKELGISSRVHLVGLRTGISLYPGGGTADGVSGDHVLLAPMYDLTREGADEIVSLVERVIKVTFEGIRK